MSEYKFVRPSPVHGFWAIGVFNGYGILGEISEELGEYVTNLEREREADRAAIRALRKATDKLSHCSHACSAPCPHTRKYIESMMFDLDVAAAIQRAQDAKHG